MNLDTSPARRYWVALVFTVLLRKNKIGEVANLTNTVLSLGKTCAGAIGIRGSSMKGTLKTPIQPRPTVLLAFYAR